MQGESGRRVRQLVLVPGALPLHQQEVLGGPGKLAEDAQPVPSALYPPLAWTSERLNHQALVPSAALPSKLGHGRSNAFDKNPDPRQA